MLDTVLHALPAYILLFAAFSIAGWIMEVILKLIQYHRFINRGTLIGPYCPIYGWGAVLITLVANGVFFRKCTPAETFLVGFFLCGALEYCVSWYMEKTSHARWWDYSNKPMNLNGRIWIGNLLLFGAAAVAIIYLADPPIFTVIGQIPFQTQAIIAGAFVLVIWTDRIVSQFLMKLMRGCIDHHEADDTEAIRQEMDRMLKDRSLLLRRINQAYPNWQPSPRRMVERLKIAREEYRIANKRLRLELRTAQYAAVKRRKQVSQDVLKSLQSRVTQARLGRDMALAELRKLEDQLHRGA